jgi:tetratricopeptide (TPR) repeat protein
MKYAVARFITISLLSALVAGCQPSAENRLLAESGQKMEDPKFYPSDDYLRMGKVHFRNGDYGLAEEKFRKAVEVTPKDAEAWLGLAASYDQLPPTMPSSSTTPDTRSSCAETSKGRAASSFALMNSIRPIPTSSTTWPCSVKARRQ